MMMNPALRVLKNSTALSVAVLFERGVAFFLPWYIARTQGRELWGSYNTAVTFVTIAAPFAFWGMEQLLPREIARDRTRPGLFLANGSLIATIMSLVVTAATLGIIYLLNYPPALASLFYLAVISNVLPRAEAAIGEGIVNGLEKMEWVGAARLLTTLLRTVVSIALLSLGHPLEYLFILWGIQHVALSLIYLGVLRYLVPGFRLEVDWGLLRSLYVRAVPFVLIIFAGEAFRQVDRIFISKLWDTEAVGLYATGVLLIQVMNLVAPAVMTALFPGMSRTYVSSVSRFTTISGQLFRLILVGIVPVTLLIISLGDWIVLLGFGAEYEPSIAVLRITAISIIPSFTARLLYRVLLASDNERLAVRAAVLRSVANLGLNIWLIPTYGILGASVAMVVTEFVGLLQNLYYVRYRVIPFDVRGAVLRPGLCALVAGLIYVPLLGWHALGAAVVASALFIALIFASRSLTVAELRGFFHHS